MERYTFLFLKGPLLTFSFLFLFFCFFCHSLKYHFVSVISIVQTSVYTLRMQISPSPPRASGSQNTPFTPVPVFSLRHHVSLYTVS